MFCQNCGNQLPDDAKFCFKCGSSIAPKFDAFADNNVFGSEYGPGPNTPQTHFEQGFGDFQTFGYPTAVKKKSPNVYSFVRVATLICGIFTALWAFGWFALAMLFKKLKNSEEFAGGNLEQGLIVPIKQFDAFTNIQIAGGILCLISVVILFWLFKFAKIARNSDDSLQSKNIKITVVLLSVVLCLLVAIMIISIFSSYASNNLLQSLLQSGYTQEFINDNMIIPMSYYNGIDIVISLLYQYIWIIILIAIALIYSIKHLLKYKKPNPDLNKDNV